ncbi:TIR domain-containing protein [Thomasclavelia spiroformis]|uniref:TIR domain-containing protein n=1 Tax=Thomasclavelia spiroformis TaxID=29348 RepID=UPI00241DFF0A|nr:TIR domain-containing protein [Thomasclavelia spiroformis]MBS6685220.1 TIR domain-containing protein [Thomasclavelia spiroformis]
MPTLKTYDIFISHAWLYGDDYLRLVNLLDNAFYFKYRNYSAPEDKPLPLSSPYASDKEIRDAIDRKILPVNCVLILGGMYAKRKWMQYEFQAAQRMHKPIIVIAPRGQERIPVELQSYPLIRWNTDSIVQAIRYYSL